MRSPMRRNTAIRMMASRSSTVANVIRKARMDPGNALANRANTANENAISVAVGTAQPLDICAKENDVPEAMTSCPDPAAANNEITPMNSTGGASIPPTAHSIGTAAALGLDSDPVVSSCFNSRPTVRKNTVSRPSCTQWPNPMSILVCGMAIRKFSSCSNACAVNGRLASNRPARAKPSIIRPDMRSDAAMRRIVAQVPLFDVAIMLLVLRSPFDRSIRKRSIKCIGGSWRSSLPHIALRCARNQLQASQKSTENKESLLRIREGGSCARDRIRTCDLLIRSQLL